MSKLRQTAKVGEVLGVLDHLGYKLERHEGTSHRHYSKPGMIWHVTVPVHGRMSEDLAGATFRSILRQMGISREEFFRILAES